MDDASHNDFDTPELDLPGLTFAATDPAALNQWGANLPLVNTTETAVRLSQANDELARLDVAPAAKLALLEIVRPLVHYICTRLDRAHIDRSSHANEAVGLESTTAQGLMIGLCTAYKSILTTAFVEGERLKATQKDIVAKVLHRLISDMSRVLLRTLQSYLSTPGTFWLEFNQLFTLSERLELNQFRLRDTENHSSQELSIEVAYLRALMIASCNPNQLHQRQLAIIFNALEDWAQTVILDPDFTDASLVIDLAANSGPRYFKFVKNPIDLRALRAEVLAYEIEAYLKDVSSTLPIPEHLSSGLLLQLVEAWSAMRPRSFRRLPTGGNIKVCVGLSAAHFFLSGGTDFSEQITNTDALLRREVNPFLELQYESQQADEDPWSQAHDLKVKIPVNPNISSPEKILLREKAEEHAPERRQYEHYETSSVNTSPGGYCIRWEEDVPVNAKVGELLALREELDPRWCIAAIRWISHDADEVTMGVELLSPRAIPVAIRSIQKKGGPTDFARALLLPEIPAIQQKATLLTPRVPFASNQKIQIQRQGMQTTAQLLETLLNTESFNQFTFRMLDGYLESNRVGTNIDSLSAMTREDTNQGP